MVMTSNLWSVPMLKRVLLATAVLALVAPAGAALAHENPQREHARDHREHRTLHREAARAHREAHEQGFRSAAEHRGYHRALVQTLTEFHYDHPNTRHDGYRLPPSRVHSHYSDNHSYRYGDRGGY